MSSGMYISSYLHTARPIAIIILSMTRCQYWELSPIRMQAREKVVVPAATITVLDMERM